MTKFIKIATLISTITCVQVAPIINDLNNKVASNKVASNQASSDEYSGLNPNALFASPIFPLSDSKEGYDISGESNNTLPLQKNKSLRSGGTNYLSVDSISLDSVHTVDKFIPYLGYSAAELQDVNDLLWENDNKMSISELLKYDDLFATKPYFSFLQKVYDSERSPAKIQISGKVTLNCENDSLFDPYFTETYNFTSEFKLDNLITNDNYGVSIPSCHISGIPGSFNEGTFNINFSKKSFFDDIYLEYVPLSKDKEIPEHYELSCENNEITLDSASLEMYGKTSNKLQFDKAVPILPVNSTDFEFPNFYKIQIDTKDINWREFVDESGKKIKYSKVYDIFDGDSYKDINIPIERFTFLGFDGKALSDGDVQFWLSKNKNPSKKDNLLFYPQDDLNSSEINYVKDKDGKVTDISIRTFYNDYSFANINWYFSSAQGYSTTLIPAETNDPYTSSLANKPKGLMLLLMNKGSAYNPTTLNGDPCVLKYALDLKSNDLTTITGQSTVYNKDKFNILSGKYDSVEGRINYEINITGIHFEIPEFNPDSARRYFTLHPEKANTVFSLKDIFDLKDVFCDFGQFYSMSCYIKFEGSVKFSFLDYVNGKCVCSSPNVETFNLNDLAISTTDPKKSCSFSKEYGPKRFCADYGTPIFSINDFDPSTPKFDTIYEMLNFKFECNSAGDYVPKFFSNDFSQQAKIKFNINSNKGRENSCTSYISLPTFSFSNESMFFVPHNW